MAIEVHLVCERPREGGYCWTAEAVDQGVVLWSQSAPDMVTALSELAQEVAEICAGRRPKEEPLEPLEMIDAFRKLDGWTVERQITRANAASPMQERWSITGPWRPESQF